MSSTFSVTFIEPNFVYYFEDDARKRFVDETSEREYFARKKRISRKIFLTHLPKAQNVFAQAQGMGIRLGRVALSQTDLYSHRADALKSASALAHLSQQSPATAVIDLNSQQKTAGINLLVLQVESALTPEQAQWLWDAVSPLRYPTDHSEQQAIDRHISDKQTENFINGIHIAHFAPRFSFSVGMTGDIRKENEENLRAELQQMTDRVLPDIKTAFENQEHLRHFFENDAQHRLIALEHKLPKTSWPQDRFDLFNPYGPLQDEIGTREQIEAGMLKITLLFCAQDSAPLPTTNSLRTWLKSVSLPSDVREAQLRQILADALQTDSPDAQNSAFEKLLRLAKDPVLFAVGGKAAMDFLLAHGADTQPGHQPVRLLALRSLRWVQNDVSRKFFMDLIKAPQSDEVINVVAQAVAEFADDTAADALIALYHDPAASKESRYWARYGLQSLAAKLKSPDDTRLKSKILKILEE